MSERAIAVWRESQEWEGWYPDPEAPSITEILRVMRKAQAEVFPTSSTSSKLGVLIARLEGENAKS